MRRIGPRKLVLLDETSTRLGVRREHAYAPKDQGSHAGFLRNFGLNRMLLAAMSLDAVLPSFWLNGDLNRPVFEYYLRKMLLPALTPRQVLVLENYVVRKGDSVAALAALDAVTIRDIQGFYSLLDFPRHALRKPF